MPDSHMRFTSFDEHCMDRALRLALRGLGRVEPNPMVGCVLARDGEIVGEGYHHRFGGPHAEVFALRAAGRKARGATAYVTLEPCCHFGKTPPCTDALLAAGVARVVAALEDPNPVVAGKGLGALRSHGVRVQTGLRREAAHRLLRPYLKRLTRHRPYVILKWAQSLDGRIATRTGDSKWISGPAARRMVHRLRARVDAILVGIGTVRADDPRLTARDVPIFRTARRIVLDSRLRTPPTASVLRHTQRVPTTIVCARIAGGPVFRRARFLRRPGLELLEVPHRRSGLDLRRLLAILAERGCTNLLVEGGAAVLASFLTQGLADEAWVFVSPRLIGGVGAPFAGDRRGVARLSDAPPLPVLDAARIGDDWLLKLDLHE